MNCQNVVIYCYSSVHIYLLYLIIKITVNVKIMYIFETMISKIINC